jgi:AcrR family transcriptional regulator
VPKYVDHNSRRQFVTEVAADIIAARGVEALTVRNVAAAAGCSTAVVSHYFADKRDLVRSTYRAASNRSTARYEAAVAAPQRTIANCLESLLPLDESSRRDWRVFVAFWGTAAGDEELTLEQRQRVRSARQRIRELVIEHGYAQRGSAAAATAARALLTLIQGIASQAVFDPEDWTPGRQTEELQRGLAATLPSVTRLRRAAG